MAVTENNFNLENCGLDTSYINNNQVIIDMTYSYEDYQEHKREVMQSFYVVADDGFSVDSIEFEFENITGGTISSDMLVDYNSQAIFKLDKNLFTSAVGDTTPNDLLYQAVRGHENTHFDVYKGTGDMYLGIFRIGNLSKILLPLREHSGGTPFTLTNELEETVTLRWDFPRNREIDYMTGQMKIIERMNKISIVAGIYESPIEEVPTFFSTYQLNYQEMVEMLESGAIIEEVVSNSYSYPYVLTENISREFIEIASLQTNVMADKISGTSSLTLFEYEVPLFESLVTTMILNIPYMTRDIMLSYSELKGTLLKGIISYDNVTGETTFRLSTDDVEILVESHPIESEIPLLFGGEIKVDRDSERRIGFRDVMVSYVMEVEKPLENITGYVQGHFNHVQGLNLSELNELNKQIVDGLLL